MAQHPKSVSDLEPLGNAGVFHRQFCFLGNSKGVPCQALHRAGDGPPSSRACHPRLCVPEALVHFPLVVLNPIFLFTECWAHPRPRYPVLPLEGSGEAQLNFSGAQGCLPCSGIFIILLHVLWQFEAQTSTFWFLCLSLQILNRASPQAWKAGLG